MRRALPGLTLAGVCLFGSAVAAAQSQQTTPVPVAAAPSFAKPVVLRGTLGSDQVQVNLRPKVDIEDGHEGDYFRFGSSQKILLAGELDGEDLFLEESENGTDISGHWEGKLSGDAFTGSWQSVDGSVKKPFNIKVLRTDGDVKRGFSKPAR